MKIIEDTLVVLMNEQKQVDKNNGIINKDINNIIEHYRIIIEHLNESKTILNNIK